MKKVLIIALGFFAFACGESGNTAGDATDETTEESTNADERLDAGSGEDISPQLEHDSDSGRMEVDTVSSATEANEQKQ
ncbi:hypothetical protein WG947_01355 [Pontibacter sp. H259]|uniref:hypothetical protein n=1 Tax=Pontibacter sp. H259 TaxID=3133421 RepID=UPI0030C2B641